MKVNTDGILLGAWADCSEASTILDIGCGNGLIALMIAQRFENASIWGVEIDEGAFLDSVDNCRNSPFADRMEINHDSIQLYSRFSKLSFDHILSNPPFFTGGTFTSNENKANVRHTIKLSHGDLLQSVKRLLSPEGKFSIILPYIEGLRFQELAQRSGLTSCRITHVYSKKDKPVHRLLLTFSNRKKDNIAAQDQIVIHDSDSSYSQDYINLTKGFYLAH